MGQENPQGHNLNNRFSTRDASKVPRPLLEWFWRVPFLKAFAYAGVAAMLVM